MPDELSVGNDGLSDENVQVLFTDICRIIDDTKRAIATRVNAGSILTYWNIGQRINAEVLRNERAAYGKQIVSTLSTQLNEQYGSSEFNPRSLRRMMQFATEFPDLQIVSTLSTQLMWSHFVEVLPVKDPLKREFYITMAAKQHWDVRQLRKEIDGIGMILCTEGSDEQIELLKLEDSGITVSQYFTELPPKDILVQYIKDQKAIAEKHFDNMSEPLE